jgi:hypothetical protein
MDSYYNQYRNQYRIYTTMNADKLASFRVDSDLWQQFQGHAKENNTNASALLVAYIKSVVNTSNVITLNQIVNTFSESNNPSLSIHDIDNRIDEKINQSIQNIDNINTLSIQDIDNRIIDSIKQGDIKDAISTSYEAMMGQFNGLLEELQDLKSQLQELKSVPPAAVPNSQIPITNSPLALENASPANSLIEQSVINLVPIGRLIGVYGQSPIDGKPCGELYHKQYLIDHELFFHLKNHQQEVEKKLKIKLALDNDTYAVREINKILKALGYELGNKQINKVETYWVVNPKNFS